MNAFGYGCSDEGTLFTMGGTLSGLFNEVGMKINAEQIFRTLPSRSTLGNWEADVATDCLFALCWQLKEAGVKQLGITTDHGHRKGQDHLVKLLSFPTLTSTGEHTIDFLCLNVDSAGHTTEEASSAISTDVEELLEILRQFLGPDVKLLVITGDAGGGASVQNLHPALITKGTMDTKRKRLLCDMHNLNKALETACIDTWGRQGIGHKTPFQMVWLFVRILKHIRRDMGRKNVDEAWAATVESLRKDPSWQLTASEKCDVAFKDFLNRLDTLEGGDDDDRKAAEKIASKAPANIQDPVNTRWGTTQAGFKLFADNWPVIYFFVRTLLIGEKSNSHLHIMCCALLSLMHNTELPTIHDNLDGTQPTSENDDDTGLDAYLNTFCADGMELNDATIAEMDGIAACPTTPLFLAVTHFLNGFNECFFAGTYLCRLLPSRRLKIVAFVPSLTAIVDCCVVLLFSTDMFNFMKMDDPFLGNGTFGQLARFGPERCAVMHVLLSDLESGGWKEKPEFKRYKDAYSTLAGEKETDYIDKATGVFFCRFRDVLNTHMVVKWTSTEIVQYVLSGDPHHAREFAR
jgi:hypothetical protein